LSNWSAFFGTSFFGAPNFNSARVLFLDDKGSIHEGTRRLRMEKGYRSKKGSKRRFLERRHLCRHGFCFSMIKDPSTKAANGKGVSLEEKHEAPFLGAPTFMSAWVLLLDDKGSIREGCEWKRSIARRKARGRISIAFRNAPHGIITVERVFYAHGD